MKMKKIALMSGIAIATFLSSCSKEETITNQLEGETWKITNVKFSHVTTQEDGSVTKDSEASAMLTASFAFDEESTVIITDEEGEISTHFYEVKETFLYLDGEQYVEIIEESSKEQVWFRKDSVTSDEDEDGLFVTVDSEITMTLEKQ
jgi:hypothetical protein